MGFRQLHYLHKARGKIVMKQKYQNIVGLALPEKPRRKDLQRHGAVLGWTAITVAAFVVSFVLGCLIAYIRGT